MRLNRLKELNLQDELMHLKPLIAQKVEILPSTIDLMLIASEINLKGVMILRGELKVSKNITVESCMKTSYQLIGIIDDYENKYLTYKELNQIKKNFKIETK